jgi:C-terminal binding protein
MGSVLVTDFMVDIAVERATLSGVAVESAPALLGRMPRADELVRLVREREVTVLIAWHETALDAVTLAALAAAGVRGIVRSGVGYDNVDLAAAQAEGITVCNVPDYGTDEVADHTLALLLWCLRGLHAAPPAAAAPAGWWNAARFAAIPRLQGRTLALLGFGRIGQATARRAQSFGLDVRWYDPYVPRGQDKVTRTIRVETLPALLAEADALSIHCLLGPETRGLLDAPTLALLPAHAVVVNTARGGVVDGAALLDALRSGRLAGAAVDVLAHEPPVDDPLYSAYVRGEAPTLLMTPHIAWYSRESAVELRRKAAAEAGRLLHGEPPWNSVS